MSSVQLDPRKAHKAFVIGDILAILTWVNDERALVLMPAHRAAGAPWFIVCESAAYKYDNPQYLARQAAQAASVLGMDETTSTWYRIADLIINYLPDLIRMPTAPEAEKMGHAVGQMTLKADGQTIRQEDMVFDKEGLTYATA